MIKGKKYETDKGTKRNRKEGIEKYSEKERQRCGGMKKER